MTNMFRWAGRRWRALMIGWLAVLPLAAGVAPAHAEYGDVVINNFSDAAGMRPVVFRPRKAQMTVP